MIKLLRVDHRLLHGQVAMSRIPRIEFAVSFFRGKKI